MKRLTALFTVLALSFALLIGAVTGADAHNKPTATPRHPHATNTPTMTRTPTRTPVPTFKGMPTVCDPYACKPWPTPVPQYVIVKCGANMYCVVPVPTKATK